MPRIEEYNAPDLGLRPSETGVEATAAAARRVNSAYNEKAELQKETGNRYAQDIHVGGEVANDFIAHQEISRGAASFSAIMAGKTKEWEAISQKADPNDPTVAASFMSGLSSQLEQYRGGFLSDKGQAWADQHINQFQNHMMNKTTADMSRAAGHAISINAEQTANNLSNTAYADPSEVNVRHLLGMSDSIAGGVVGTSPTLTEKAGVKAAITQKSASQIVRAGVEGYISQHGELPDWINKPEYSKYVNLAEMDRLRKQAVAQQKSDQLQAKQADLLQKQVNTEAAKAAGVKNMTDNVTFDESSGRVLIKPDFFKQALDNAKMPGASADDIRAQINWGEHQQSPRAETVKTNPTIKSDLIERMTSGDNPTTETQILRSEADGQLSTRDGSVLRQLLKSTQAQPVKDPILSATFTGTKQVLGTDSIGQERYAGFLQDFLPRYQELKRTNNLPPNALDLNDPKSLISQAMAPYKRTPKQMMMDRAMQNYGGAEAVGAPAAAPGSTFRPPADWQFSPSKQQYRDPEGNIYNINGNKVSGSGPAVPMSR
jgi:hypothetical protein